MRALQQVEFESLQLRVFEFRPRQGRFDMNRLYQVTQTDYHLSEIQSRLFRRSTPTRKQDES
jgi:hypothetical protein